MGLLKSLCRQRELKQRIAETRPRLYRTAYAWCHDTHLASDLVQETLSKAIKRVGQLREENRLESWLFGIMVNCWRDHFRAQRETLDIDELELAHDRTPESEFHTQDIVNNVRRSIERLPEGQRQVVTLVDLEGFSYADVAVILEIPVGTVMSRLSRARQTLADYLLSYKTAEQSSMRTTALRRVK